MSNALGAECAAREVTLNSVLEDAQIIAEHIGTLESIAAGMHDHLMGATLQKLQPEGLREREVDAPPPPGILPQLCTMNSYSIARLQGLREKLNQISYELGERK